MVREKGGAICSGSKCGQNKLGPFSEVTCAGRALLGVQVPPAALIQLRSRSSSYYAHQKALTQILEW
jgi:hypothetical protein